MYMYNKQQQEAIRERKPLLRQLYVTLSRSTPKYNQFLLVRLIQRILKFFNNFFCVIQLTDRQADRQTNVR